MLLRLYSRSGRAMQLKKDEVDKALNITENMTNFLPELHFLPFF